MNTADKLSVIQSLQTRAEQKLWDLVNNPASDYAEYLGTVARIQEILNCADEIGDLNIVETDEDPDDGLVDIGEQS